MAAPSKLVGPALEKILVHAGGRKYAALKDQARELLDNIEDKLDNSFRNPAPSAQAGANGTAEYLRRLELQLVGEGGEGQAGLKAKTLETFESVNLEEGTEAAEAANNAPLESVAEEDMRSTQDLASTQPRVTTDADGAAAPSPASKRLTDEAALTVLGILRLAIETRKPPVVELALDLIQKLIAHKYLQGRVYSISARKEIPAAAPGKSKKRSPVDDDDEGQETVDGVLPPQAQALELLCRCDDIADDAVELRVLKGLLTAVTSNTLHVHGQALLLAVRTCYNIFLMSKSEVNQTTAKASLTQMVNIIFQRMEHHSEVTTVPPIVVTDVLGLPPTDASSMSAFVQSFLQEVVAVVDPFGTALTSVKDSLDEAFTPVEGADADSGSPDKPVGSMRAPAKAAAGAAAGEAMSSITEGAPQLDPAPAAGNQWWAQGNAGEEQPQNLQIEILESKPVGEETFVQQTSGVTRGISLMVGEKSEEEAIKQAAVDTVLQKDSFLVFRALCKLSIRTSDSSAGGSDQTAVRGKVLALELLKILLENSGQVFQTSDKFTSGIKQYLCLSLLKNCASAIPQALRLSCSIFLTLISKFRQSLKAEIGVFFPMILLRSIEPLAPGAQQQNNAAAGPTADIGQRTVVLRCLEAQCGDGQLLVDLFVNYDCDLEGANLFERMVTALVRIAQTPVSPDSPHQLQEEERALRLMALNCLTNILKSLVDWYQATTAANALNAAAQVAAAAEGTSVEAVLASKLARFQLKKQQQGEEEEAAAEAAAPSPTDPEAATPPAPPTAENEAQYLENQKAIKKGFQQGVALFNKKPKKGILMMQEQGMIGPTPEEVAKFLATTSGLEKTMIGEYLGERDDQCIAVMHAFVDALDFTNMQFDGAIRKFLDGFRLPGEAQKIDRLMEKFAERYVNCNPETFKSADVAYVLAYSVIMLNTDAHNPMVKSKMSRQDFLRNNRGINDGGDLPEEFMTALYERIVNDEIKMKDNWLEGMAAAEASKARTEQSWMDSILSLIPGRKQAASAEPSDEAIRRTHDYLRERAKGATFFTATEGETVRPMLDVAWAPMLGAFSVLFEEFHEGRVINHCLAGFVSAIRITSLLDMSMLRNTFVTSLARFTMLHAPASMQMKSAKAFRSLLFVADDNGNNLHEVWPEVLRAISRFELLQQIHAGTPTDMALFSPATASEPSSPTGLEKLRNRLMMRPDKKPTGNGKLEPQESLSAAADANFFLQSKAVKGRVDHEFQAPPADVLKEIDPQELNRIYVHSERLDSEGIVEFVRALCTVAREELNNVHAPRVYSLTKIVEIAHFNMNRIRLVWSRIWAVLSDFFVEVGCHKNLQVAMYGVDSMRQLAMKFLERDELANFSFQNDFLRPFVVVMRQSKAVEIRELIIRCVSQMVLARVANVKSGWKSMFMVFTTAASDEQQTIVRLSFDTIEKIVREHFHYITETETTTFTDCVNCLIAFTNNPHSIDVSLNAIAFLRFCAMELAEGDIGDVEQLPEGTQLSPAVARIQPVGMTPDGGLTPVRGTTTWDGTAFKGQAPAVPIPGANGEADGPKRGLRFTDKDEHMYFWFPLLAGLSELTFDPRPDIRYSALEVLFDTLKFHGAAFTTEFWTRIFDSVLLPIFDHVRAEVTDTTTFTDDKRREEVDSWLFETCTQCLQHMVDIVVQFYPVVQSLLGRILDLLLNFIRRPHQSLASVGVAALVRLIVSVGPALNEEVWLEVIETLACAVDDTVPAVPELVAPLMEGDAEAAQRWSLSQGAGSRRLHEVRTRAAVQLLLVQASGEIYSQHSAIIPAEALAILLDAVQIISAHARGVDADAEMRRTLALAQEDGKVAEERRMGDPPLLRLENEGSHAYLSMLLHINAGAPKAVRAACEIEQRLVQLCGATIMRFQALESTATEEALLAEDGTAVKTMSVKDEFSHLGPQVVATLRAISAFSDGAFRRNLKEFFPLLTRLISCQQAPPEVQRTLSELFASRVGPLLAPGK